MGWQQASKVSTGQFLMAEAASGWNIDVFSSLTPSEIATRVQSRATNWQVQHVQFERGLFGAGGVLRVFGQAQSEIAAEIVAAQVSEALNSFWTVGNVSTTVQVSTDLVIPATPGSQWQSTLQIVALAVVVVGVVWGISQLKGIMK